MNNCKALLFDVFGTVVDWRSSLLQELGNYFKDGSASTVEQDWEAFALDWRALYQPAMQRIRSGERGYVLLDELHRENLLSLLPKYGLEGLDEAAIDHINTMWHRLQPWADSLPGMYRLRRQYVLASLSNGNIALMVNMARHSSIPWDAILGSEPTRGYKPEPKVYLRSAEMLGLAPEQCLMVAAHNDDLRAAAALGFKTAYINRPDEYGENQNTDLAAEARWDLVCASMTELADQLGT